MYLMMFFLSRETRTFCFFNALEIIFEVNDILFYFEIKYCELSHHVSKSLSRITQADRSETETKIKNREQSFDLCKFHLRSRLILLKGIILSSISEGNEYMNLPIMSKPDLDNLHYFISFQLQSEKKS